MKIITGGQTGVDRAALDFAIHYGLEHGGWCPRGRRAEDGTIGPKYKLMETESEEYNERTSRNILDSDATLIIVRHPQLTGGTALTRELALQHGKPVLVICEAEGAVTEAEKVIIFVKKNGVKILNVAGPRESEAPGIGKFVQDVLDAVFV